VPVPVPTSNDDALGDADLLHGNAFITPTILVVRGYAIAVTSRRLVVSCRRMPGRLGHCRRLPSRASPLRTFIINCAHLRREAGKAPTAGPAVAETEG
jgi:hypothetical protein